jgi:hypothetical protein
VAHDVIKLSPNLPTESVMLPDQIQDVQYMVYLVASNAGLKV